MRSVLRSRTVRSRTLVVTLALAVAVTAALAGCGPKKVEPPPQAGGGGSPPPGNRISVNIVNFAFDPVEIRVKKDTEYVFVLRNSGVDHTFTASDLGVDVSVTGGTTKEATFKFTKAGSFEFICRIHPSMKGRIIID